MGGGPRAREAGVGRRMEHRHSGAPSARAPSLPWARLACPLRTERLAAPALSCAGLRWERAGENPSSSWNHQHLIVPPKKHIIKNQRSRLSRSKPHYNSRLVSFRRLNNGRNHEDSRRWLGLGHRGRSHDAPDLHRQGKIDGARRRCRRGGRDCVPWSAGWCCGESKQSFVCNVCGADMPLAHQL